MTYFITFHTYGTWLHGHERGSVDDDHNELNTPLLAPSPSRLQRERDLSKHPPITLNAERRFVVERTIREVCEHRGWKLHAMNARTTHVHLVVSASQSPERVLNDLKAYCTRRMREAAVLNGDQQPWSHHGSTRYLHSDHSFVRAIAYVLEEQGSQLEMRPPLSTDDRHTTPAR